MVTKAPASVFEAAKVAKELGFNVVPVSPGTKRPFDKDWVNREFEAERFRDNVSLGIHWSGSVVEVDLESRAAVRAWEVLGPPSGMRWGRPGKENSHWAYRVDQQPGSYALSGVDPVEGKKTLIELRGAKHQTVMPPSRYDENYEYTWASGAWGEPGDVGAADLDAAVRRCGAAVLLSEYWSGQRHNLSLGLGAWMSQLGWEVEEIEEFVTAVNAAAENPDVEDSEKAVRDSAGKWQAGEEVAGWAILKEHLPPLVLNKLVKFLGVSNVNQIERGSFPQTDVENGKWMAEVHRGRLVLCDELGGWFRYDGKRWVGMPMFAEREYAHLAIEKMVEYAAGQPRAVADAILGYAVECENSKRVDAMIKEGKWRFMVPGSEFDTHPFWLNIRNGTLDLKTMELHEHEPTDMLTAYLDIDYDRDAECPKWIEFLKTIFGGDQELVDYMQRVLGYSLTGDTSEQCLFFFYGKGKNGKSTLIGVVEGLLGPLAGTIDIRALTNDGRGDGANASPYLVMLKEKRFVSSRETDENRAFSEGLIKDLTGGDTITARALYKEPITFTPQFKLMLYGNYKPIVKGQDEGIWRRMRIIPFEVQVPPAQRVRNYHKVLLESESPGILRWLIDGARMWLAEGLQTPEKVSKAVEEYREDQDVMELFLTEEIEITGKDKDKIGSDDMYLVYSGWASVNGERTLSKRMMIAKLKEKSIAFRQATDGKRYFLGVRKSRG